MLTDDLEATPRLLLRRARLRGAGERPPLPFDGFWLTLGGDACVHVAERGSVRGARGASSGSLGEGPIDHVAFRREGYEELAARLAAAGVEAVANVVPGMFRQLYVTDPNGVRVELNVPDQAGSPREAPALDSAAQAPETTPAGPSAASARGGSSCKAKAGAGPESCSGSSCSWSASSS